MLYWIGCWCCFVVGHECCVVQELLEGSVVFLVTRYWIMRTYTIALRAHISCKVRDFTTLLTFRIVNFFYRCENFLPVGNI